MYTAIFGLRLSHNCVKKDLLLTEDYVQICMDIHDNMTISRRYLHRFFIPVERNSRAYM